MSDCPDKGDTLDPQLDTPFKSQVCPLRQVPNPFCLRVQRNNHSTRNRKTKNWFMNS